MTLSRMHASQRAHSRRFHMDSVWRWHGSCATSVRAFRSGRTRAGTEGQDKRMRGALRYRWHMGAYIVSHFVCMLSQHRHTREHRICTHKHTKMRTYVHTHAHMKRCRRLLPVRASASSASFAKTDAPTDIYEFKRTHTRHTCVCTYVHATITDIHARPHERTTIKDSRL